MFNIPIWWNIIKIRIIHLMRYNKNDHFYFKRKEKLFTFCILHFFSFSLLLLFLPSSWFSCFVRNIFIKKQWKRAAYYAGYSLVLIHFRIQLTFEIKKKKRIPFCNSIYLSHFFLLKVILFSFIVRYSFN